MDESIAGPHGRPECPPHLLPLRERVRGFLREHVLPWEDDLDGGDTARGADIRRKAKAAGLWGLPLPDELGGGALGLGDYAHIAEVEGSSDHGPSLLGSASLLDVNTLARHAAPAVRDRYAARLASGELAMCNAMTEPDVPGSDPTLVTTTATRRPDGTWLVTGRKWFVTGAGHAGLAAVLARTSGASGERDGLSVLLVPTGADGFEIVRELPVLGAGGQWEIALHGVTVPGDHVLGEPGRGLRVAGDRVRLGRLLRCLRWLGQAQRAYDLMCDRARARRTAAGRLGDLQHVQRHLFESLLSLRTTRPLVFEAVGRVEAGRDARTETALAKVAAARTLHEVTDAAVQVYGAEGLGPDTALPALLRAGRAARLLDGPDELHFGTVARRALG
ncbi:acyl-CoA dehydrogenase family protein [Actinomadura sp. WMMB 499]|uniref:acyl-CoA dehydrogenase family protein n=1 Tax=Actinomadura sp. WMMB 499 TaxID=1219491 RepID=UPI00124813C8|nr:acyl-CoA dehydrogenase [Actinomadura sp. WMMB 499]QFG22290.1 acyl-CoA dehydrogenase [Actinomadura sp. WMMB 499]